MRSRVVQLLLRTHLPEKSHLLLPEVDKTDNIQLEVLTISRRFRMLFPVYRQTGRNPDYIHKSLSLYNYIAFLEAAYHFLLLEFHSDDKTHNTQLPVATTCLGHYN